MSRNINAKKSVLGEEELQIRNTSDGKLIFTEYHGQKCALLLSDNRLLAAQFFERKAGKMGAIYIGKVKNVVKNIDAFFVEIADKEICFLSGKDAETPFLLNRIFDGRILEGDELLVQVTRDAQKTKQASVTANISLFNDSFAISIGSERCGFSGKLSKEQKQQLEAWLTEKGILRDNRLVADTDTLVPPFGLVVRTQAGKYTEPDELIKPFYALYQEFQTLLTNARHRTCFTCLKPAPSQWETVFDSLVSPGEYSEIVTDVNSLYQKLLTKDYHPNVPVRLYQDQLLSLSKLYSLESKIDNAINSRVWLKSGAYLVLEQTEALTVIDVNSGKYEARRASDETFYQVNREAAYEIALQLRLRNLSGIIIVDFINMKSAKLQLQLLEYLRDLVKKDKVKTTVVDITPLGLVELTRKKSSKPLSEQILKKN